MTTFLCLPSSVFFREFSAKSTRNQKLTRPPLRLNFWKMKTTFTTNLQFDKTTVSSFIDQDLSHRHRKYVSCNRVQ